MAQFNNFNAKSFIINNREPEPATSTLSFVIDSKPIKEFYKDTDVRTYRLFGQQQDRITQNSNLVDKIKLIALKQHLEEEEQPQANAQAQEQEMEKEKEANHENDLVENGQRNRYFTDLSSYEVLTKGLCRRCKQPGHYERMCTEEQKQADYVCRFCLGNHYHLRCSNTLCFKCNQYGHISKNCDKMGIKCHRCSKNGHKAAECGVLLDNSEANYPDRSQLKKIRCLTCLNKGHINCSTQNEKVKDKLYPNDDRQSKYIKLDYINHNQKNPKLVIVKNSNSHKQDKQKKQKRKDKKKSRNI